MDTNVVKLYSQGARHIFSQWSTLQFIHNHLTGGDDTDQILNELLGEIVEACKKHHYVDEVIEKYEEKFARLLNIELGDDLGDIIDLLSSLWKDLNEGSLEVLNRIVAQIKSDCREAAIVDNTEEFSTDEGTVH